MSNVRSQEEITQWAQRRARHTKLTIKKNNLTNYSNWFSMANLYTDRCSSCSNDSERITEEKRVRRTAASAILISVDLFPLKVVHHLNFIEQVAIQIKCIFASTWRESIIFLFLYFCWFHCGKTTNANEFPFSSSFKRQSVGINQLTQCSEALEFKTFCNYFHLLHHANDKKNCFSTIS